MEKKESLDLITYKFLEVDDEYNPYNDAIINYNNLLEKKEKEVEEKASKKFLKEQKAIHKKRMNYSMKSLYRDMAKDEDQVNHDGSVYLGDGMLLYPDGTVEEE
jgi:hypothetical protein